MRYDIGASIKHDSDHNYFSITHPLPNSKHCVLDWSFVNIKITGNNSFEKGFVKAVAVTALEQAALRGKASRPGSYSR